MKKFDMYERKESKEDERKRIDGGIYEKKPILRVKLQSLVDIVKKLKIKK